MNPQLSLGIAAFTKFTRVLPEDNWLFIGMFGLMPADDRWQAAQITRLTESGVTDLDARYRPAQPITGQPGDLERRPDFQDEEVVLVNPQVGLGGRIKFQIDDLELAAELAQLRGKAADDGGCIDLLDVRSGSDDEAARLL